MRDLPFPAGSLSGLWVAASLLHLPHADVPSAVAEFARVARSGAPLFCSVKEGEGEGVASDGRFFSYHTEAGITALLSSAGWNVESVSTEKDSRRSDTTWIAVHARRA